jgi:hypothetical protein
VDKKMVRKSPIADSALRFSNPAGGLDGALSGGVPQKEKTAA